MACGVHVALRMKLRIFTLIFLSLTASAQVVEFGVQGGVPTQPPLGRTDNMPFILGPTVDVRIFSGLSLETGVLWRWLGRASDNFAFQYPKDAVTVGAQTSRGSALDVPLLAKYHFLSERGNWRPFLSVGPTVRRTSITTKFATSVLGNSALAAPSLLPFDTKTVEWHLDPTIGAGVTARVGRFHLEPELRYSYWGAGKSGPAQKNQVDFMLGFRF